MVVVKSTNESHAARLQLQQAEYAVLDENWERISRNAAVRETHLSHVGPVLRPNPSTPDSNKLPRLDHEASKVDAVVVASIILADLDHAVTMAKQIEAAGVRVLELNTGTPYANQAAKGAVSTELDPARIKHIVDTVRSAISIPLWIKITGQSERVPDLGEAAFDAGGNAVVLAGRILGLILDLETHKSVLDTTLGVASSQNIDTLLLAGVATTGVVLSTARQAFDLDYKLVIASDCCAASDEESQLQSSKGCSLTKRLSSTTKKLLKLCNQAKSELAGPTAYPHWRFLPPIA